MKRKAKVRCVGIAFCVQVGPELIGYVQEVGGIDGWCVIQSGKPFRWKEAYQTRAAAVRALVKSWREAGNG